MRQGQKNNRSRGRGRRPQNPVNRIFESNGPDVKIRGNASHVAEKYNQLARDALVSGNTVTAENYFQHAEHYQRILAAAQAYNQQQQQQSNPQERGANADDDSESGNQADGQDREEGRGRRPRRNDQDSQNQTRADSAETPAPDSQPAVEDEGEEARPEAVVETVAQAESDAVVETAAEEAPVQDLTSEEAAPEEKKKPRKSKPRKSAPDDEELAATG